MPVARPRVVVKLGGSLLGSPRLAGLIRAIVEATGREFAIVCGGGPFANAIRDIQARIPFSDPLAHRFALDAMDQLADVLAESEPRLRARCRTGAFAQAWREARVPIWSTGEVREGHRDIAESWAVTSDSLAAWVAKEIEAECLVLVKSVDVAPASPAELAARGLVDDAFPAFISGFHGKTIFAGPSNDDGFEALLRREGRAHA
jgi:aspartokinase-like uncharacterized kinase